MIVLVASTAGCQKRGSPPLPRWEASGKLLGKYVITSASNPGGQPGAYTGNVEVSKSGSYYSLTYALHGGQSYRGVGIETGEYLGVGWSTAEPFAIVVYSLEGRRLDGRWASSTSGGKLGSEVLSGPPGPTGSYEIVEAFSPETGKSYRGTVSIQQNGSIYRMLWSIGGETWSGVGIKKGSLLFAGRAPGGGAVVVYTLRSGTLAGQWAQPATSELGSEYLKKG